jgi:tRNA threonylcarbamoyl adenosine modification protein (Sua5/YciO/YrdC/YwlC family)
MADYLTITDPKLVEALSQGAVCVVPTDTVYGIVCSAHNAESVARLYKLKHREKKPGTLIAASIDQLVELGLKRAYIKPVEQYWPGPLSVVIPTHDLEYLHEGLGSLAVRIPSDPHVHALLEQTGPLMTSSANLPGRPTATTVDEARGYFGDAIEMYVDGGDLLGRAPSTIVRVVDDEIEVLRAGAVTIE